MPSLGTIFWRTLLFSTAYIHVYAQSHDPNNTASIPIDSTFTVSSCDARTINYITHTLPQSCLTSSWTSTTPSSVPSSSNSTTESSSASIKSDTPSPNVQGESQSQQPPSTATPAQDESQDVSGDGAAKPFMSFEDWKEMMLRETGQDPRDLHARNTKPRDRTPPDMGHAGLGEEDEISLNFDSYLDNAGDKKERPSDLDQAKGDGTGKAIVYEAIHGSKDAGKTCKERFSYSSFDAGATILKASPGAQNPRTILVENKDSYMLLQCSAKSKFVIVELSDDVLIDTVVLANFEFFSSMFRHFTVSVSDRYPVKMDKWKQLGMFEARNSRDIQPFLVKNPQIFSKYVRIEFLSHWGNEFYCPVSLLRIHGSRMLDSWKELKDDDSNPDDEAEEAPQALPSKEEVSKPPEPQVAPEPIKSTLIEKAPFCEVGATSQLFVVPSVCLVSLNQTTYTTSNNSSSVEVTSAAPTPSSLEDREQKGPSTQHTPRSEHPVSDEPTSSVLAKTASPSATPAISPTSPSSISSSNAESISNPTSQTSSSKPISTPSSSTTPPSIKPSPANTVNAKKGTTGTVSGAPASPTVQEGFFKAISKRLIAVETNLTLSLKYVEDQARHMSETLQRTEQKQISKANLFFEELNRTVLTELRSAREQYDQIWQSTVIALESQREQSNREIVALSSRLNLLADEVVFQKRMAIVQAVLLLSCLLLVIFSRGVSLPYLAPLVDQGNLAPYDLGSPTARLRALYGDAYNADEQNATLLAARQRAFVPVTTAAEDHTPAGLRHRVSLVDEMRNDQAEREQLSPPQTPRSGDGFSSSSDLPPSSRETHSGMLRHAPAIHSGNSRKPLPALPENPASP
ncbi:UNC-like C-terminal-domain-containing protein [Fusarium flagelliforme]|uniref:UNC-like C-terminal-domain-containing protein n=1 Tax=Fusarium flagelliforme TaxID=2675880 RepID=UPI001E8E4167|nr:UNC-like C-terminal-domain-containing protein [Fusarium flagelliforme]KAH7193394.1 UNC-like C-terminal-domain-containing protein [Fusarium flagelliforme]